METDTTEGARIFHQLEAIQVLFSAFGYDFHKLSLEDAFSIKSSFKAIIENKINEIDKVELEQSSEEDLYEKAGGSGLSEQVYKADHLIDYDSNY